MLKILLIDDSKAVHAFVVACLQKYQIELRHAPNGREGLAALEQGPLPDLILLDWEMPVMNGPDTLTAIKAKKIVTPVVMMTTRNAPEEIERMLNLGAAEYIMKPFTDDILVSRIESICARSLNVAA